MGQYKRVFAAIDGRTTQHAVVDRAIGIASDNEAELVLGHVLDAASVGAVSREEALSDARKIINAALAGELMRARCNTRIPRLSVEILVGAVAETLVSQLIEPLDCDLVVCGERDLANADRLGLGSMSSHLVSTATCDVLVVKQR